METLSWANCTKAKIRIWYNSCTLSTSLLHSPRLGHVSIPLRSFAQNQTNSICCDRWLNWMDFFYSEYHAGSCRLSFQQEYRSITLGQSNPGRLVSVILLAFSNPKVIPGSRLKTFVLDKTFYSETPPLQSGTRRNSCKELWFRRKGIIGKNVMHRLSRE